MIGWLDKNHPSELLDLSALGLTRLPENLPESLQELHLENNQLTPSGDHEKIASGILIQLHASQRPL